MGKDVTDPEGLMLLQEGSERERDGKFCLDLFRIQLLWYMQWRYEYRQSPWELGSGTQMGCGEVQLEL